MSASTGLTLATEVEHYHQGGLAVKEEFSFYVGVDWGVDGVDPLSETVN